MATDKSLEKRETTKRGAKSIFVVPKLIKTATSEESPEKILGAGERA
jgi:hypothetical protein